MVLAFSDPELCFIRCLSRMWNHGFQPVCKCLNYVCFLSYVFTGLLTICEPPLQIRFTAIKKIKQEQF